MNREPIDNDIEDFEDNEWSFGIDFDEGDEFRAQDHINEYLTNGETNMFEDFEDLLDSALDD